MKYISTLLVLSCFTASVGAETIREMSLEEKADQADTIVRAQCTGLRSEWRNGRIVTRAQFSVSRDLTQRGTQQIELTTLGGVAEHPVLKVRVRSTVSEQPEIRLNDEAILFTRRVHTGERMLVGGRQGYVRLTAAQSDSANEQVVRSQRKVVINGETSGGARKSRQQALTFDTEPVAVGEYEQRVRAAVSTRSQRVRQGVAR